MTTTGMCVKHDGQYWAWAAPSRPDSRIGDGLALRIQQTKLIREICAKGTQCSDKENDQ